MFGPRESNPHLEQARLLTRRHFLKHSPMTLGAFAAACMGADSLASPAATRPATWAMSTKKIAPTLSAMARMRAQSTTCE